MNPNENENSQSNDQQSTAGQDHQPTPKRKKRGFRMLPIILVIFLLPPLLFAGWLGFVPGLSTLMGAKTAKDLGVRYSEADLVSYFEKTTSQFRSSEEAPLREDNPNKRVVFADQASAQDLVLTQEEITAAINESNWLWMPLKNTQVRMTSGTVEVSGNLNTEYLRDFISFVGSIDATAEEIDEGIAWANRLAGDAPVYMNVRTAVVDSALQLEFIDGQVGRFPIPSDIANSVLTAGTNSALDNTPYLDVTSASFEAGGLRFSGTYPATVYVKTD